MKSLLTRTILAAWLLAGSLGASAQDANAERQELEALRQTTMKLIELMVQSGLITQEKAETLLRQARRDAALANAPGKEGGEKEKVVRVPYVPQMVRDNIKEEIRQEVVTQAKQERWGEPGAMPEWISRLKWEGDILVRYQRNQFDKNNFQNFYLDAQGINSGTAQSPFLNTTENSDLYRLQLRLGMEAQIADWIAAGLRISTGSNANPGSAMQTLGNTLNRYNFAVDRAFLKLDPYSWATASVGRIPNPFFHTDLVWDADLNFEGGALTFKPSFGPGRGPFLTLGAFPLETPDCTNAGQIPDCSRKKWIYGGQVGMQSAFRGDGSVKVGLAIYDFQNIAGTLNDPTLTTSSRAGIPKYMQKGNTLFNVVTNGGSPLYGLASDFTELNLTASVDFADFDPVRINLTGDFVKNIGYNADKIRERTAGTTPIVTGPAGSEYSPRTKGYQARLTVGSAQIARLGDWQVSGAYKYLERDAVVDGLTDQDFHLGGTDAKGWILGFSYGIARNAWIRTRWLSASEIDGPPLSVDVLQFDLNAKF